MDFFAAIKEGQQVAIRVLDVDAALQRELTTEFNEQADDLLDPQLEQVSFDPKRPIEKDSQVYTINNYSLPVIFREAADQPDQLDALVPGTNLPPIKSLFASGISAGDGDTLLFQAFQATRLLKRDRITVLFRQSTLHRLKSAGLTFDDKLGCIYKGGKLYFKSFYLAHSCLDLADYLAEATDKEIAKVLDESILHSENAQNVVDLSDGWMRRRFAAIRASGVLKKVTPKEAQSKAKRYGVRLKTTMVDGELKISFPNSKKEMKDVLRFFNEGYYQGELTGTLFSTDSNATLGR